MLFNGPDNPRNCPVFLGIWTLSTTGFLGPTQVVRQNGISIGSAVFAALTNVTNRQTDTQTDNATPSVAIDRIWLLL